MKFMNDNSLILLDTNILVYAFDDTDKKKQKRAIEILVKCFHGNISCAVNAQNLAEFFFVVTRKVVRPFSPSDAGYFIQKLIEFKGITKIAYTAETLPQAISLVQRYSLKIWDALIIATMLEHRIFKIYTENQKDFSRVKNIQAINPFKE